MVAALVDGQPEHAASGRLLENGGSSVYVHGLTEVSVTLLGGRLGQCARPALACRLLEEGLLPWVTVVSLTLGEHLSALRDSESRGVRGGAIYDDLHLVTARKAKATRLYTLDPTDFAAFHRPGNPEIAAP